MIYEMVSDGKELSHEKLAWGHKFGDDDRRLYPEA